MTTVPSTPSAATPADRAPHTMRELPFKTMAGVPVLVFGLAALIPLVFLTVSSAVRGEVVVVVLGIAAFVVDIVCLPGLFSVQPNEARALTLFGRYVGTVRETGLRWANPFLTKRRVSLRVRNFESEKLKVNDKDGNPVDIAAVVVWKVVDSAEALFHVDNYENFVHVQGESALRHMASHYAYDAHLDGEVALRSHTGEIAEKLKSEIQERLLQAGVEVVEARITHLA